MPTSRKTSDTATAENSKIEPKEKWRLNSLHTPGFASSSSASLKFTLERGLHVEEFSRRTHVSPSIAPWARKRTNSFALTGPSFRPSES